MAIVVAACRSSEVAATRTYAVQVETPLVWTSGRIVLTSPDLVGRDTSPVVVVGTDTVATRYAPPDSLIAKAPSTPGLFDVLVGFGGRAPAAVGTVQLAGRYAGVWNVGPIGGRPQVWPGSPQSSFAILMDSGLALVDPRVRTIRRVLPRSVADINCMNGVGPATGGQVAVMNCSGVTVPVQPEARSIGIDTGPGGGGRFVAQLAPGRWLHADQNGVSSLLRNATGGWDTATTPYQIEEPFDVVVSPRGDRAVIIGRDWLGTGMPVFSASSPNPVYFLTGFHELWGAAFSDGGDTLFAVGPPAADSAPNLTVIAASNGDVLTSVPAWPGTYRLQLDPRGRWIYLAGAVQDPAAVTYRSLAPALEVLDRGTLAPVTLLHAPFGTDIGNADLYPVVSPAEPRLYLVASCAFCSAGTVPIYAFDLMP